MIKGLTHDVQTGVINSIVKFKGKISTGWQPNEGPNKTNAPKACGFFRFMKQVVVTRAVGGAKQQFQEWAENKEAQDALIASCGGSANPRRLEFMCMYQSPEMMWESYLAKYSSKEGLLCKSYGEGTVPTQLTYNQAGQREWKPRTFDGKAECPYESCPDYTCKPQNCKEMGVMKIFPLIDLNTMPYKFETRSKNTILAIGSALDTMYNLAKAAWAVQCKEAGKKLPFDGLFGVKMCLVHKKIKSGGNEVFITQLEPSREFAASIMQTIQRGIEKKHQLTLAGSTDMVDVGLLERPEESGGDHEAMALPSSELTVEEEKDIAADFVADAAKAGSSELDAAAAALANSTK